MSNIPSNHPSIRVHAPPGGHSNNIFGTSEFEQSAANKKKHMESDIFGSKKETNEPTAVASKSTRNTGNNIFGTDTEQPSNKSGTIAGQFKQTQMKSNIFGNDEPASSRPVSDKNKSDIFGVNDKNEQNKQSAVRQGLRDPNASRMGYNPINGEAYAPKENINTNEKEVEPSTKVAESEHVEAKDDAHDAPTEKPAEATNGNAAQKGIHTSVRVFHPPGGRSNGPLW